MEHIKVLMEIKLEKQYYRNFSIEFKKLFECFLSKQIHFCNLKDSIKNPFSRNEWDPISHFVLYFDTVTFAALVSYYDNI